eukprot:3903610-Prymnesium_polylepis.1
MKRVAVCYASPFVLSNVSSDPRSKDAAEWWGAKAKEIYDAWPGFGGFLVKVDSEGSQVHEPLMLQRPTVQTYSLARSLRTAVS